METMNVHQALAELKMMDKRITAATREPEWVITNKHSNTKINGVEVKEFVDDIRVKYQKVLDLIRRRDAIKRAVVNSNAVTKVTVAGVEYTVAEAIDKKNNGIDLLKHFARKLATNYNTAKITADRANGAELDRRADEHVRVMLGDTDHDAETARAIGADCILLTTGHQGRDTLERLPVRAVCDTLAEAASIVLGVQSP
jgi:hypothetical protein